MQEEGNSLETTAGAALHGSYGFRLLWGGTNAHVYAYTVLTAPSDSLYYRVYVRFHNIRSSRVDIASIKLTMNGEYNTQLTFYSRGAGQALGYEFDLDNVHEDNRYDQGIFQQDTTYCVEIHWQNETAGGPGHGGGEWRLNGTTQFSDYARSNGQAQTQLAWIGNSSGGVPAAGEEADFDDCRVDTTWNGTYTGPTGPFTYYVDPQAGSDSNTGTSREAAWQHIPGTLASENPADALYERSPVFISAPGWAKLNAGDTILAKGGTVSSASVLINSAHFGDGSPGNLIKILSGDLAGWGSGRAVIDGGSDANGHGPWGHGFHIIGSSYIHIEGFEIRNLANAPFDPSNPQSESYSAGILINGGPVSYDEIVGNLIHNVYGIKGKGSGFGIMVGIADQLEGDHLIEKNTIFQVERNAIALVSQGFTTVRYNYCYQTMNAGVVVSSSHNLIYRNMIAQTGYPGNNASEAWLTYEMPNCPAYALKFVGNVYPADHNLMYDNLVWDCSSGIGIFTGSFNQVSFNTVYHSGFQGLEGGGIEGASFALGDEEDNGIGGDGNTVTDNIFYFNRIFSAAGNVHVQILAVSPSVRSNNTISDNVIYQQDQDTHSPIYVFDGANADTGWYTLDWLQGPDGFSRYGTGNVASGNVALDPLLAGGTAGNLMNGLPTGFNGGWQPNSSDFAATAGTPRDSTQSPSGSDMDFDIIMTARATPFTLGGYQ